MTDTPDTSLIASLSRRHFLGGTSATAVLVALGVDLAAAPPAFAAAPVTAAGVIALGRTYMSMTFLEVRDMVDAPWGTWAGGSWCAWFVSWLTRGLGYFPGAGGYTRDADAWEFLPSFTTAQAQVGDFARITGGTDGPYHIGIVTQVDPIRILDGNRFRAPAPAPFNWSTTIVQENVNYNPATFRRPTYSAAPAVSTTLEDDMPFLLYNAATAAHATDRRAYYTPGSPLKVLDLPQAYTAVALMKQFHRVSSLTQDAEMTTNVTDDMWNLLVTLEGTA